MREKKYLPSVCLGINDFHGTQQFYSEYVAMSKQFGPLDLTLGYGGNLFGDLFKNKNRTVSELKGIFGGVEYKLNEKVTLLAEYDPTDRLSFQDAMSVKSHFNVGIRWKPWSWLDIGCSYQRGSEYGFQIAVTWPFCQPLLKHTPDEPFYGPVNRRALLPDLIKKGAAARLREIQKILLDEGFSNVKVTVSGGMKTLYIEYENRKYLSQVKALGRVLRVLAAQTPSDVEIVHVIALSENIPLMSLTVAPSDVAAFLNGKISIAEFRKRTVLSAATPAYGSRHGHDDIGVETQNFPFTKRIQPLEIETYLNDPSGFYQARIGPGLYLKKELGTGLSLESHVRFPVYSNVHTNMPPISDKPIRSDIVDYLSHTGVSVENLFLNKFAKTGDDSYCRLSAGYLELQFAGISAEYLKTFKDGRFGLGSEVTFAAKRSPGPQLDFTGLTATTTFINGYVFFPETDLTVEANAGKFLAGDNGVRLQVTRNVRGGSIFLWYTKTDTSNFTGPNRGYEDKGVGFTIPISVFEKRDRQGTYDYAIAPWSRDVGQKVDQPYGLYDFIREFTPAYVSSHWNEIIE